MHTRICQVSKFGFQTTPSQGASSESESEVRNPNQPGQYQAQRKTLTFQGKTASQGKAESRNDLTRAEGHSALCRQSQTVGNGNAGCMTQHHSESDEYEESLLIQAEAVFDDTAKPSDDEGGWRHEE